ncbi:MAG: TRASH domain-containing protein [Pyrobaculum sp.]|uniref:Archaeal TRASH domain protein n=1 Tax=Pyrobaculum oguniense (strain DSM 13380 / JCM 10595 / TE7) TaxID=698757 RepID=H6Q7J0_PYROT|nr:Archaeal TRASH domain protein [Pyrobaculum oguniense TE7]
MPFELKITRTVDLRCSNCGKIITGEPIVVKTCCVNKPWVFCSRECYKQFVAKWTRNQDAGKGGGTLRKVVF